MKVTLEKDYRKYYTLEDLDRAKIVIKYEREVDEETPFGWAKYAVNEALKGIDDYLKRIIEAKAETARNSRIWDAYEVGSETMDVWISGIAKTGKGFLEFGAYLTDIWNTGIDDYSKRMWIAYYKREK